MATITKLEDFQAWVRARELNTMVHQIVLLDSFKQLLTLKFQMQKSSRSVMANLAEGFGRKGNAEFLNFISIAMGSLAELKSDVYSSFDQKLISDQCFTDLIELIDLVGKLSNGMAKSLRKSPLTSTKFKKNISGTNNQNPSKFDTPD
ncbi:MAG: four helix bundle protein [Bacteroidetes bacterium]|nr:four helix bundle protein [Bacteroidota bacterium]